MLEFDRITLDQGVMGGKACIVACVCPSPSLPIWLPAG
jgi:hypothetical protein